MKICKTPEELRAEADLRVQTSVTKVNVYERLLLIVRGDISAKAAGYNSLEHATICLFNTAEKEMAKRWKEHEKKYPH